MNQENKMLLWTFILISIYFFILNYICSVLMDALHNAPITLVMEAIGYQEWASLSLNPRPQWLFQKLSSNEDWIRDSFSEVFQSRVVEEDFLFLCSVVREPIDSSPKLLEAIPLPPSTLTWTRIREYELQRQVDVRTWENLRAFDSLVVSTLNADSTQSLPVFWFSEPINAPLLSKIKWVACICVGYQRIWKIPVESNGKIYF